MYQIEVKPVDHFLESLNSLCGIFDVKMDFYYTADKPSILTYGFVDIRRLFLQGPP